jgi:hypothetical protein
MPDSFSETSSESIFGRLGNAIKGVLFGIVLIPSAIVLLSWNEGRAVKTAASLKEGAAAVVSVSPDAVQTANEGKLIHLSGEAKTEDTVTDPMFQISRSAIRLSRKVEMYQWKESKEQKTHKKLGGGTETETTCTYSKKWSDSIIDSSDFKHREGHQNPTSMIANSSSVIAENVTMGAFKLPAEVIDKMKGDSTLSLTSAETAELPAHLKEKVKLTGEALYVGADPASAAVGDQKITFTVLKPGTFSILARQTGNTLGTYPTKAGRDLQRVESGNITASEMFEHAKSENTLLTWGLRLLGLIVMTFGISLILSPIATLADVIPLLGDLVGMGTGLAALIMASFISAVVIAVSWFAVRPMLSIALVAFAIGAVIFGKRMGAKKSLAAVR